MARVLRFGGDLSTTRPDGDDPEMIAHDLANMLQIVVLERPDVARAIQFYMRQVLATIPPPKHR